MANEGSYGSLGGMAAGAALGSVVPGIGTLIGAGLGGTAGGLLGGLFGKKQKGPDISGELARISALFAQMRAQAETNINRQAAQGRTAAASNLAARGIYRSPVSQNTFNALEDSRLNSIATANSELAGQEAGIRSRLLESLMGLNERNSIRAQQTDASRTGMLTGLASNLLLGQLLRGQGGAGGASTLPANPDPARFSWMGPGYGASSPFPWLLARQP